MLLYIFVGIFVVALLVGFGYMVGSILAKGKAIDLFHHSWISDKASYRLNFKSKAVAIIEDVATGETYLIVSEAIQRSARSGDILRCAQSRADLTQNHLNCRLGKGALVIAILSKEEATTD